MGLKADRCGVHLTAPEPKIDRRKSSSYTINLGLVATIMGTESIPPRQSIKYGLLTYRTEQTTPHIPTPLPGVPNPPPLSLLFPGFPSRRTYHHDTKAGSHETTHKRHHHHHHNQHSRKATALSLLYRTSPAPRPHFIHSPSLPSPSLSLRKIPAKRLRHRTTQGVTNKNPPAVRQTAPAWHTQERRRQKHFRARASEKTKNR